MAVKVAVGAEVAVNVGVPHTSWSAESDDAPSANTAPSTTTSAKPPMVLAVGPLLPPSARPGSPPRGMPQSIFRDALGGPGDPLVGPVILAAAVAAAQVEELALVAAVGVHDPDGPGATAV